jgi:hypothetical protein
VKKTIVMGLALEVSFDQLLLALLQLPAEEKIRIAERLRASAAAEKWRALAPRLPNVPEISMAEIVAEVKAVRKQRHLKTQ